MVVSLRLFDWMACSLQLKAGYLNIEVGFSLSGMEEDRQAPACYPKK